MEIDFIENETASGMQQSKF